MSEKLDVVTIDGPSGVGKSTISRGVAAALGYTYLDTGAMYRAVALLAERTKTDPTSAAACAALLEQIDITLLPAATPDGDVGVLLNGEDVSSLIRSPEISMLASRISAQPAVRTTLTTLQQDIGRAGRVVAEGRDTGTVVFPRAAYKFYLDASPQERTRRRAEQLRQRGEEVDEEELLRLLVVRDKQDSERAVAPLKKAEDALLIDTTALSIEQVLQQIVAACR